jgi:predicted dehydrogenase
VADAEAMVAACRSAGVPLLVNENWRWQAPIRELRRVLCSGGIGDVFRARIEMISGFPVFDNQPSLTQLDQFILTDLGTHTLDTARFLFGESDRLYCQTARVHSGIRGEDVATVCLRARSGATVVVAMAYAGNPLERECFPQTLIFVEGTAGSAEIAPDYWLRVTTAAGVHARRVAPPRYAWADPAYDVVHSSIVPCQRHLLAVLRGDAAPETSGEDNLRTLRLVFSAYDSAASGRAVPID